MVDPAALERRLVDREQGVDPDAILAEAQSPEAKAGLRAQTDAAIQLAIFGAPSFTVGTELFWGNDRLEDALDWGVAHRSV